MACFGDGGDHSGPRMGLGNNKAAAAPALYSAMREGEGIVIECSCEILSVKSYKCSLDNLTCMGWVAKSNKLGQYG